MAGNFLHGVEVLKNAVTKPATDVDLSTIGLIGIAPYADAEKWPLDTPVLISGADTGLISALTTKAPAGTVDTGTLPAALSLILDQTSPIIVAIRVAGDKSYDMATLPNIVGGVDSSLLTLSE